MKLSDLRRQARKGGFVAEKEPQKPEKAVSADEFTVTVDGRSYWCFPNAEDKAIYAKVYNQLEPALAEALLRRVVAQCWPDNTQVIREAKSGVQNWTLFDAETGHRDTAIYAVRNHVLYLKVPYG